jgi:periplasmic protein TonB
MTERVTDRMTESGGLWQCMVHGDKQGLVRARRQRRKALAVSIFLQMICVGALLIGPLLEAPGALPAPSIVTPVPPYRGGGAERSGPRLRAPEHRFQQLLAKRYVFRPIQSRRPAREVMGESAPDVPPAIDDFGPGNGAEPSGVWIPGGRENGLGIEPPRRPPAPRKPVLRSEGVMAGALIRRIDPFYPAIARAIHLSGTVQLRAIIGTNGSVQSLEVLSGSPILARAAVAAVRQWRYRPTLLNGRPVEVETYVTVNFVLGDW